MVLPILGQDTESSSNSKEIKVRGIPFTPLASARMFLRQHHPSPSVHAQGSAQLLGSLKPVGSLCALVKGQQLSCQSPQSSPLTPQQQNPFRDVPKLITQLFPSICLSRILGKLSMARASPSGLLLIALIRGFVGP